MPSVMPRGWCQSADCLSGELSMGMLVLAGVCTAVAITATAALLAATQGVPAFPESDTAMLCVCVCLRVCGLA
jgi:hypothetical protein